MVVNAYSAAHEGRYRELAATYDICGYKRIYQVHPRETGGSSVNHMFFALAAENTDEIHHQTIRALDHRIERNG
jgi:hypothetical protein